MASSSLQQSAPGSKSSKFVHVNPLDPFVRPFQNENDASTDGEAQGSVLADNLNRRLEDHVLQRRRQEEQQQQELLIRQQEHAQRSIATTDPVHDGARFPVHKQAEDNEKDSDSDLEDDDDDDPVLSQIRERRLREMQLARLQHNQNLSRGHGEVRTISQDEFLPECLQTPKQEGGTSASLSRRQHVVAVHFFHRDFERCQILDHHLKIVAAHHVECKFVRIDAEKAPFFVQKLGVRTLPTLLVFENGQVMDRLVGFEGLVSAKASDPDQWKTSQLEAWLSRAGAITTNGKGVTGEDSDSDSDGSGDDDEKVRSTTLRRGIQRMNIRQSRAQDDD